MFIQKFLPMPAWEGEGAGSGAGAPASQPAAGSSGQPAAGSQPGAGGQPQPGSGSGQPAATRPDGLEDAYWDTDKNIIKWDALNGDLKSLKTLKAEADVIAQGVPEKPEGYKFDLGDFKPPEGMKLTFDEKDPVFVKWQQAAHAQGFTQEDFAAGLRFYAQMKVDEAKAFEAKSAEALKPLGQAGPQRIEAVKTALTGRIGALAEALTPLLFTSHVVEGFEALLRTTQAAMPGSGAGGGQPKPDWTKMNPNEKFAYAYDQAAKAREGKKAA